MHLTGRPEGRRSPWLRPGLWREKGKTLFKSVKDTLCPRHTLSYGQKACPLIPFFLLLPLYPVPGSSAGESHFHVLSVSRWRSDAQRGKLTVCIALKWLSWNLNPVCLKLKCSHFPEHFCTFTHRSEQVVGRERGKNEGDQLRDREETVRWRHGKSWPRPQTLPAQKQLFFNVDRMQPQQNGKDKMHLLLQFAF